MFYRYENYMPILHMALIVAIVQTQTCFIHETCMQIHMHRRIQTHIYIYIYTVYHKSEYTPHISADI